MIPKSEFTKNVLTVMTGTSVAQAITIAIAPILTRLYTPGEFGILYLFSALSSMLIILATGRFELAILLPEKKDEAIHTAWLAGIISTIFSFLILVIVFLGNKKIGIWLGEPDISPWLYLLPVSIFIGGWYITLHYWHNRNKRFKILTGSKFVESGTNAVTRIGMGAAGFGTAGLIVGTLLAQLFSLFNYIFYFLKNDKQSLSTFSKTKIKTQAKRFKNFPKDMIPAGFFNTSSNQLPNILTNVLYATSIAGFYGFMQRIVRLPIAVIGKSFDEVFKQKAIEEIQELGHCKNIFSKTLKKLLLISVVPFIIFFFVAPTLFGIVFGENWIVAGEYAQLFTIPFFINFLVNALGSVFYLYEKTKLFSRLNLFQLSLVIFAFFCGWYWNLDAKTTMLILAIAYTISYSIMFYFLIKIVNQKK